jgi:hypothetical protein
LQVSTGAIAGIAVACGLILIAVTSGAIFYLLQKRRTRELSGRTNPFGEIPNNMAGNCIALKATKYFFKKKKIKLSECVFHGCTI